VTAAEPVKRKRGSPPKTEKAQSPDHAVTTERDELTDDERRVLLSLVHWEIEHSRFPLSERIRMLKRIRLKFRKAVAKARRETEGKPQRG
jgi:hypothetical protein